MGNDFGFITDMSFDIQHSDADIGTGTEDLTLRGTIRDFTPAMLETLLEIVRDRDDSDGMINQAGNAEALEKLQAVDAALYDKVVTAEQALASEQGILKSIAQFDEGKLGELWPKVDELDTFYSGCLADINDIGYKVGQFAEYVRDIFLNDAPIDYMNNLASFNADIDRFARNVEDSKLQAAKSYVLAGATEDFSDELATLLRNLGKLGYSNDEVCAALWGVETGTDLSILVCLGREDYEALFAMPTPKVSGGTFRTLANHSLVLLREDPSCSKLQGYVNALVDVDGMSLNQMARKTWRDKYLENIYSQTMQMLKTDSLAMGYAMASGATTKELWWTEHNQLMAMAGLWGNVYGARTDGDVHNFFGGTSFSPQPSSVSIDRLTYMDTTGFGYDLTFYTAGRGSALVVPYKTIQVSGEFNHHSRSLLNAQYSESIQRLDAEVSRQWIYNLDNTLSAASSIHPAAKAAYIGLKAGLSMPDGDGVTIAAQSNKVAGVLDTEKNISDVTFVLGLLVSVAENNKSSKALQKKGEQITKDYMNSFAGMGYSAVYEGAKIPGNVVYGEPWNVYAVAGLVTWSDSEIGIRYLYGEGDAVLSAFSTAEEVWKTTPEGLSLDRRFILYGKSGLNENESVSDLDWGKIEIGLKDVEDELKKQNLNVQFLDDLEQHYMTGTRTVGAQVDIAEVQGIEE